MNRLVPVILAALGAAAPAPAQTPDSARTDSASMLREVVVRATRPAATVGGSATVSLRLDSLGLPPAPTLESALREIPLLHVRRNSRGEAELSARGSESRQVAVLVDGIPLTLAWDARADLSVVPAGAPVELRYTRGLSTMLLGPNVLGGIVEVSVGQSLRQPSRMSAGLTTGVDRHGSFGTSGHVDVPWRSGGGSWRVRAGAGFSDSPGHPLADGVVEPLPGDNASLRRNTDARSVDGFGSVRYLADGGAWFAASGSSFRAERGIAAELGTEDARFWRYPAIRRSLFVLSGGTGQRTGLFGGIGDLEASVGVDLGRTEIDAYTSRDYSELAGFENGNDRTLTFRLLADHTLGARADLSAAFTLADIRHDEFLPAGDARYRQQLMSGGVESVMRLVQYGSAIEFLNLSLGGALDVGRTPESGGREPLGTIESWGGRVGLTMGLPGGATRFHGALSRRGRFPALRELYSGALNRFAPNPDLRPERLVTVETGVTHQVGRAEVQAVLFRSEVRDAVVRITLPDRRFMRVNRNRLRSHGVELLAVAPLGPLTLDGDLTIRSVSLTDTDAGVSNQPENLPEFQARLGARTPIALGIVGGLDVSATGRQYCIDPGTGADATLAGGTIVDATVSRTFGLRREGLLSNLQARLSVDNVGDTALYDQCGLPRPGRLLRLQFRLF